MIDVFQLAASQTLKLAAAKRRTTHANRRSKNSTEKSKNNSFDREEHSRIFAVESSEATYKI